MDSTSEADNLVTDPITPNLLAQLENVVFQCIVSSFQPHSKAGISFLTKWKYFTCLTGMESLAGADAATILFCNQNMLNVFKHWGSLTLASYLSIHTKRDKEQWYWNSTFSSCVSNFGAMQSWTITQYDCLSTTVCIMEIFELSLPLIRPHTAQQYNLIPIAVSIVTSGAWKYFVLIFNKLAKVCANESILRVW